MAVRTLLILALSSFLFACGKDEPLPPPVEEEEEFIPTTNDEHNQMLQGLGFTTDLGARLDPAKRQVPTSWHPLKKLYSTFQARSEVYAAGVTIAGKPEHLFDDESKAFEPIAFTSYDDNSWTGARYKNGIAADFDGDGLDEVFIAYYVSKTSELRSIYLDFETAVVKERVLELSVPSTSLWDQVQPAMAAGDLDGDGRDEVAIAFTNFYVIDNLEGELVVKSTRFANQDSNNAFVAIGNTDWDGADELVVTYTIGGRKTGRYAIYDGVGFDQATQAGSLAIEVPAHHYATDAQVTIGDVDGDRMGEIVFAGRMDGGNAWGLFMLEYLRPNPDGDLYQFKSWYYARWSSGNVPRPLFTLDWDRDGRQEVFFYAHVFEILSDAPYAQITHNFHNNELMRAAAGDVDGDGREDIVHEWGGTLRAYGLNALQELELKKDWGGSSAFKYSMIVAPLNMDRDSAVVRYNGEQELLFTDPHIISVMASPPYKDGIGQNVDATASTFGKSVGQTVEEETSLGFSTGFSVGYEADFGIFGGAEFKMSVETSLDFISGQSATLTKYHSYTTGPGEDLVVFTTVPFDVFYYTVISSPRTEDVGRTVSINVPRDIQTLATTLDFYNRHNGGGQDVDQSILGHAVGDITTYPTKADRDRMLAAAETREGAGYKALWNGPMSVGQGSGLSTIGISSSQGSMRGAEMNFEVKFEFESKSPGGATAGTSVGFHYGHTYTFETENEAFFEGTVGHIPEDQFATNRYSFGLFVYPDYTGGQKFLVMNYWVE